MGNRPVGGSDSAVPATAPAAGNGWVSEEYHVVQERSDFASGFIRDMGTGEPCREMRMRVEAEALVFLKPSGDPLVAFPYYSIMCWGHSTRSFQFRVFQLSVPEGAVIGRRPVASSRGPAIPGGVPSGEDASASGGAASASAGEESGAGETEAAGDEGGPDGTAAGAGSGASSRADTAVDGEPGSEDSKKSPRELMQQPGVTFVVLTPRGAVIEQRLLVAVRTLMSDMSRRGVSDLELLQVTSAIDLDPDRAIDGLRQLTAIRRFDAKQAHSIVAQVGRVSPFDQVEAAVLLYPALMNAESFHVVLGAFEDADDKDNVCHRLGLDLAAVLRGATGVAAHKARR